MKVTLVGAGSGFGWRTIVDLASVPGLRERLETLMLVDISEDALRRVKGFAEHIFDHHGIGAKIETTTERRRGLHGSDYVVLMVAVRRYELWEQDFRVPVALGFEHPLGENGGPGALFHTLRSYHVLDPILADIREVCPEAFVFNFSNPESRVVLLWKTCYPRIEGVGLCHGMLGARDRIAGILGRPLEELEITAGGINHFFWMTRIEDRATGEDLYPELRSRIEDEPSLVPPLVGKMVEACGLFTYPSDDHIGEYLAFAAEFTGLKWPYGREVRSVARDDGNDGGGGPVERVNAGELDPGELGRSGEILVDVLADLELGREGWHPAVNVLNDGGYVENLPLDAAVEVPARVGPEGIDPEGIGPLPEFLAAFTRLQISIQKLILEGFREGDRGPLLQALLLDPFTTSYSACERLLDDMFELQAEYLPPGLVGVE